MAEFLPTSVPEIDESLRRTTSVEIFEPHGPIPNRSRSFEFGEAIVPDEYVLTVFFHNSEPQEWCLKQVSPQMKALCISLGEKIGNIERVDCVNSGPNRPSGSVGTGIRVTTVEDWSGSNDDQNFLNAVGESLGYDFEPISHIANE